VSNPSLSSLGAELGRDISRPSESARQACLEKWGSLAKPPGSLGKLETTVAQLAAIQETEQPSAERCAFWLFAGDHGIVESGVSAWPRSVTGAMLAAFSEGKGAINQLCQTQGIDFTPVDAGVAERPAPRFYQSPTRHPIVDRSLGKGTDNLESGPAMTRSIAEQSVRAGFELISGSSQASHLLGLGEMGIGNTASASLLTHALSNAPLEVCVGRGAGLDDEGLKHKRAVLERAMARQTPSQDPLDLLAQLGGFEIGMMAGAAIAAAHRRQAVLVDGFIATAAIALACQLVPSVRPYCLFCHASAEPGHAYLLAHLDAHPLLKLNMALGEGTGAAMAVPLIRNALACYQGMDTVAGALARVAPDQGLDTA